MLGDSMRSQPFTGPGENENGRPVRLGASTEIEPFAGIVNARELGLTKEGCTGPPVSLSNVTVTDTCELAGFVRIRTES
jgi:hypothetical protein